MNPDVSSTYSFDKQVYEKKIIIFISYWVLKIIRNLIDIILPSIFQCLIVNVCGDSYGLWRM